MRSLTAGLEILSQTEPGNIFGMSVTYKNEIYMKKNIALFPKKSNPLLPPPPPALTDGILEILVGGEVKDSGNPGGVKLEKVFCRGHFEQ